MSTVKELADAEAARAEAEEPDEEAEEAEGEPAPPPPPEPEPEPVGPSEEQMKALDGEDKRHEKNLARIMGADFSYFARCGSCDGLGYYMPPPPADVQLKGHPSFTTCETCDGWGEVLTGSKAQHGLTRQCPDCGGTGYLKQGEPATATISQSPPVPTNPSGNGDPRVEALKEEGYTVIPPFTPPVPTPGS